MKAIALICAESLSIDQATNRLSVFNILEDFNVAAFPSIVPSLTLVAICVREESEPLVASLEFKFVLNSQELSVFPMSVDFQGRGKARVVANIQGLPITAPGLLRFSVQNDGKELAAWEANVNTLGVQMTGLQVTPGTVSRPVPTPAKKTVQQKRKTPAS